jgi:hypothetical protein
MEMTLFFPFVEIPQSGQQNGVLKGSEFTFQYLDGSPLDKTLLVANFKFLTDDMCVMEQIDLREQDGCHAVFQLQSFNWYQGT